jgi:hypothetical protein
MFKDYSGRNIRLTDNRLEHILTRLEMEEQEEKIRETLLKPDKIKKVNMIQMFCFITSYMKKLQFLKSIY